MNIQQLHYNFRMPTRGTEHAGGYDLYMPEHGSIEGSETITVDLGFAAEVPVGHVALLLPRSSAAKLGLELRNTVGVIDADYRGPWLAKLGLKKPGAIAWEAHERLLQFVIVPVATPELALVASVSKTERGSGGFGSTGT